MSRVLSCFSLFFFCSFSPVALRLRSLLSRVSQGQFRKRGQLLSAVVFCFRIVVLAFGANAGGSKWGRGGLFVYYLFAESVAKVQAVFYHILWKNTWAG